MYYDLPALQRAYQSGTKLKFLFFWGHTSPEQGGINETCFSQWWRSDFIVDSQCYSCAEQYMMAEKARLFHDEEMLAAILAAKHPKQMKEFGRKVKNFDASHWDEVCFSIVKKGNKEKFSQNEALRQFLLKTHKRILVEASPRDRIWGIGMGKSNPDAENPMKWKGKNLLGFALTKVRDELLEQTEK